MLKLEKRLQSLFFNLTKKHQKVSKKILFVAHRTTTGLYVQLSGVIIILRIII